MTHPSRFCGLHEASHSRNVFQPASQERDLRLMILDMIWFVYSLCPLCGAIARYSAASSCLRAYSEGFVCAFCTQCNIDNSSTTCPPALLASFKSLSLMASSVRVRGACEYCHHRKIRCIVNPSSPSCHNCLATGVTCFFAPRLKSGRPRRSTSQVIPDTDSGGSLIDTPSTTGDHTPEKCSYNALDFTIGSQTFFPSNRSWYDYTDTYQSVIAHQTRQSDVSSICDVDSYPDTTSKSASMSSTSCEDIPALGFDAALKLCTDLDHRTRNLGDTPTIADAEAHMQVLDEVCMASITVQSSIDSASRSIVLAALYKALDLCHLILQACGVGTARTSQGGFLRRVLVVRKLDIVVTFCKICFSRMGAEHVEGVKRAGDLHTAIERFLKS